MEATRGNGYAPVGCMSTMMIILHQYGANHLGHSKQGCSSCSQIKYFNAAPCAKMLSLWLIGTVRAEPETVISRAWVQ